MALHRRGVEYIEVRCLDVNPFSPLGITEQQACFLDIFLLYCALADSPKSNMEEGLMIQRNQKRVVNEGRKPGLKLEHFEHGQIELDAWLCDLMSALAPVADLLDNAYGSERYSAALAEQLSVSKDFSLTPSAKLLKKLESAASYRALTLEMSASNTEQLRATNLNNWVLNRFQTIAAESLAKQAEIEAACDDDFDAFLENYFKQYETLLK